MDNLSEYCAPGSRYKEEMIAVHDNVRLRVITFYPAENKKNPPLLFIAGWVSMIIGWKEVLREMTKDFTVYYMETREKISSQVRGKVEYSAEAIGSDIETLVSHFGFQNDSYILFGSSLGATAVLECYRSLKMKPLCLVLIGPNAVFRVPKPAMLMIYLTIPRLYLLIRPVVKWYLRTFRLDIQSDRAQYIKYCNALNAADPWKLKKAAIQLSKYEVWNILNDIDCPALIVGASKDVLHEPENLKMMASKITRATYLDLETNSKTHSKEMVQEMRIYLKALK